MLIVYQHLWILFAVSLIHLIICPSMSLALDEGMPLLLLNYCNLVSPIHCWSPPLYFFTSKPFNTEYFFPAENASVVSIALGRHDQCQHFYNSLYGLIPAYSSGWIFWHCCNCLQSSYPFRSWSRFLFQILVQNITFSGNSSLQPESNFFVIWPQNNV